MIWKSYKNKEHILHKTIIKNNPFKHKNYFNNHSKHSNKYFKFIANINHDIPKTYNQAING